MDTKYVARVLRALELLAFRSMSAPQLAEALRADPRSTRRVLEQLAELEYVVCSEDYRRLYRPTMRLAAIAGQVVANATFVRHARPYIALVAERTGATAELVMPSYESTVCVMRSGPDGSIAGPAVLELAVAHTSAAGRMLLATRPRWRASVIDVVTSQPEGRVPIFDVALLNAELDAAAAYGYVAMADAIAAPVIDDGQAVAALQVTGPGLGEETQRSLVAAARELSDNLIGRST